MSIFLFANAVFGAAQALQVGVSDRPPFAFQTGDTWDGLAVQLWREVADDLNLTYDFVEVPRDELDNEFEAGVVALGITGRVTAEAETRVDFATPYIVTALGIATPQRQNLLTTLRALFSPRFFWVVFSLSILLLVVGILIWLLERSSNEDNFGGDRSVTEGIGSGFWWAAVTMTTIGYGDKAPITFWGRTLAFFWMLVAMAITASLTAALVSAVGATAQSSLSVPSDLRSMEVGAVPDTPAADFLQREGIPFQPFDTPLEGLQALEDSTVADEGIEAFVDVATTLTYLKNENSLSFNVTETDEAPQRYAFSLPEGDERFEPLQRALLERLNGPGWKGLLRQYVPKSGG